MKCYTAGLGLVTCLSRSSLSGNLASLPKPRYRIAAVGA